MATGRIGVTPTLGTRWSKTFSGVSTSVSGLDDNSVSLVYSVGYEQVYRNGVLLSRGNDYTATTGNSITLIDATIAGDIIEVFANQLVPLTDAISKGQFTAKGALLSATAASTPAVLTVGSNDQVLTADSSTSTGLKWAAVPTGGMTLISTTTLTGAQVTLSSIPQTYNNLRLVIRNYRPASDQTLYATFNNVTSGYRVIESTSYYANVDTGSGSSYLELLYSANTDSSTNSNIIIVDIDDYANTATFKLGRSQFYKEGANGTDYNQGFFPFASYSTSAISSIELLNTGAANFTSGTVLLYGVK